MCHYYILRYDVNSKFYKSFLITISKGYNKVVVTILLKQLNYVASLSQKTVYLFE